MTRPLWLLCLSATLLPGCLQEDEFIEDYDEAACAWLADCNEAIDEGECLQGAEAARSSIPDGCDWNRKAAKRCLDGMWNLECPGQGFDVTLPEACDFVWEC